MEFFTSDTHFKHHKIHGIDGFTKTRRHYESTDEMDNAIITAWNRVVSDDDTVYHAGDFAMNVKPAEALDIMRQLKGNIVLVKGNHDDSKLKKAIQRDPELSQRVTWHDVGVILKRDKKIIYITHYPLITGNRGNLINLHGHIHELAYEEPNLLNIGVDSPEIHSELPVVPFGTPLTLREIWCDLEFKEIIFGLSDKVYTKHGTIE